MQPRRRPSAGVNHVGDGDLLRQVLTRNFMTVTFDTPEYEEKCIGDGFLCPYSRDSSRPFNNNNSGVHPVRKDGSRDEHFTFRPTVCLSVKTNRSSESRCDKHATCACDSLTPEVRAADKHTSSQQFDLAVADASLPPACLSIGTKNRLIFASPSDDKLDPVNDRGLQRADTTGVDCCYSCCLTSAETIDWAITRCRDSQANYNCSLDNEVLSVTSNFHTQQKFQKTEDSSVCSGSSGTTPLNQRDRDTPHIYTSASTAFPFPPPLCSSTSRASWWTSDDNTAGTACSNFSSIASPFSDAEESSLFSPIGENTASAASIPSYSSPEDLSRGVMSPTQGLSPVLNQRASSSYVTHFADDQALSETGKRQSPLSALRENRFRRYSDIRTKASFESGRCATPKLIQRSDLTFGPVIGKGGFGRVHKDILGVNLCDDLRGEALIIMELVNSRTLQALLDEENTFISLSERLRFGIEVCAALRYLHGHQLVHLDVKPQNVLLGEQARCKLADFGNLTRTRSGIPREDTDFTQLLGTLPYRAPELMKGQFPSCKADIYSLGITLWQMASRRMPHVGANPHWLIYQVTKNDARPISHSTGSDITEIRYCELYEACWDARPRSRPDAEDVQKVLMELREGEGWECGWGEDVSFTNSSRLG
ncbi:serine/threonine-protein kinase mos [Elysia marginata]|uniref:non-specific serine/threonine protein kinase n=1 Tax=Elysia marginata TaxID=1093978 RepID=A0AAV4FRR2_9GAST|nr:serine/threonine-protein kinase mos [Elysia marginata]